MARFIYDIRYTRISIVGKMVNGRGWILSSLNKIKRSTNLVRRKGVGGILTQQIVELMTTDHQKLKHTC